MLEMSQRDRDRLVVVRQVGKKQTTVTRGAELLGLSRKQMGRLRDRYLEEGDAAVIHRGRGSRSNRAKPEGWRQRVMERAREPLFHDFRPTLRAEHLSRDPEIGPVDPYTLRRWLIEEELWTVRRRGTRHRSPGPDARVWGSSCSGTARIMPGWRIATTESIIRRGLRELNVELIRSLSPQGKGRVERDFGTAQDRLVKEMRIEGISTVEAANQFLEDFWIPFWNQRFTVEPADPKNRRRPLPKRAQPEILFAETWTRGVASDFTLRFKNRRYQIRKEEARGIRPRDEITVELRVDGSTHFRWRNRYLSPALVAEYHAEPAHLAGPRRPRLKTPAPQTHGRSSNGTASNGKKARPKPPRPAPDHPWRNNRVGRGPKNFTPGEVKVTST
jgi:hypothetical protein